MPNVEFTLVHVSDLHLDVDAEGARGDPRRLRAIAAACVRGLDAESQRALVHTLASHSRQALHAMLRTVESLVREARERERSVIVVQTGDVAAYGARIDGEAVEFPALAFWERHARYWRSLGATLVQLYGDHDVWPGHPPALRPEVARRVERALRSRVVADELDTLRFAGDFPDRVVVALGGCDLALYRFNTVRSDAATGSVASSGDHSLVAFERMARETATSRVTVQVVAMHHPPHWFPPRGGTSAGYADRLLDASEFAAVASRAPIHLVLAGHRHLVDPPVGATVIAKTRGTQRQPPLPAETLQLTAGSATQRIQPGDPLPSLCTYDFTVDLERRKLAIDRTIYSHESRLDSEFRKDSTVPLARQIAI